MLKISECCVVKRVVGTQLAVRQTYGKGLVALRMHRAGLRVGGRSYEGLGEEVPRNRKHALGPHQLTCWSGR